MFARVWSQGGECRTIRIVLMEDKRDGGVGDQTWRVANIADLDFWNEAVAFAFHTQMPGDTTIEKQKRNP